MKIKNASFVSRLDTKHTYLSYIESNLESKMGLVMSEMTDVFA